MAESGSFFLTKQKCKPDIGFTTGTCAAAASCAAARMLVTGENVYYVSIMTPKGLPVFIEIVESSLCDGYAVCAVRKMSGTDPDVTDGVLVYSRVSLSKDAFDNSIVIDGGSGVGRVTLPGLDQAVGNAAINHVPRQMIEECVRKEIGEDRGAKVIISIPAGVELASKTFNPRLGIKGGISVLGTSGIVEPMSQQALLDTIQVEINMRKALQYPVLPMVPGNYGKDFLFKSYGFSIETAVTTSNFIYDSIRKAVESGFTKLLFIGHIGKLVKVAGGVKNTHSKYGDRRMEILCSIVHDVLSGPDKMQVKEMQNSVSECISTDEAVRILINAGCSKPVLSEMTLRIQSNMSNWAGKGIQVEVIVFSNVYGVLGQTEGAGEFINCMKGAIHG
ncbi:MAG: cobalt-precorrin-5B (C(1))-methyltransferase CbiD [Treponema sp.]|nr:cobalt-precorrin-5B (C(1))-methyltransferase CbiD [Treponema sp.]